MVKVEADFQETLNETRRKVEMEYDEKIANMKDIYKIDMDKSEARYKELINNLETELNLYKSIRFNKEEAEAKYENCRLEVKVDY